MLSQKKYVSEGMILIDRSSILSCMHVSTCTIACIVFLNHKDVRLNIFLNNDFSFVKVLPKFLFLIHKSIHNDKVE